MSEELSPRQALFVQEYLASVDFNATDAARRAGYAPACAHVTASRLLRLAKVQAAIAAGMAKRARRLELTQDAVLRELTRLAFSDLRQVAKWGPGTVALLESAELCDDAAAAIAEVGSGEHGPKVKLHPKQPALELLGRHLGLFDQRLNVKMEDPEALIAILEAGRARVKAGKAAAEASADAAEASGG